MYDNDDDDVLAHFGILRKSGRYPWGSGDNPHQRSKTFQSMVAELEAKGLTPAEVAKGLGFNSTTELRATTSIAKNQVRAAEALEAQRLKEKGLSNVAIAEQMGKNESSVRALLNPSIAESQDKLIGTANFLRSKVDEHGFIDVGVGVENYIGVSQVKKDTALKILQEEGYKRYYLQVEQAGTGKKTNIAVLGKQDSKFTDIAGKDGDPTKVKSIAGYTEDGGKTFRSIAPPQHVSSKRIGIRYAEEGGAQKDGVIELRRGVADLDMQGSRYAQVRIGVDGTHYLKGMAMYSDKLPDGVDIMFNTNKSSTGNKLDAMKPIKTVKGTNEPDPDLPFGSIVRQKTYVDPKTGKTKLSPLNIVGTHKRDEDGTDISTTGEEGGWRQWSSSLSSQMLSKQSPALAQQQLDRAFRVKKDEFDEINSLTNPVVKRKLLESFADGADSASVHLKAAGLPRTANHVILPINSLKDTEVYAPNFRNGERVVLIRHPHGGTFEIPELTVNNKNREALSVIKNAADAIGINSKVAERLSGADFDGDTVLVIPNPASGRSRVKTTPALDGLKNFEPKSYKPYDGMKTIDGGVYKAATNEVVYGDKGPNKAGKQRQMGDVSNLITDMTIKGANTTEIAQAVRHSMVVIDAEKHVLNYKQSYIDNGISGLKAKYQTGARGGADTLISKAKSEERVPKRKPRAAQDGGPIDPRTGEKRFTPTGESYVDPKTGKTVISTIKSTKMAETADAHTLVSKPGTVMEKVYADHANRLKSLANSARKEALFTKPPSANPSAKKTYAAEVSSLTSKLNTALKNAPLERQAQLLAKSTVSLKKQAQPGMDKDEIKKMKNLAIAEARVRTGAKKQAIVFTDKEWQAIQAGAVSATMLRKMLDNADMDQVKALATPRARTVMTDAKIARAQGMLALGYTQAEVAAQLGVPTSTLHDAIKG